MSKRYAVSDRSHEEAFGGMMYIIGGRFADDGSFISQNDISWKFAFEVDEDGDEIILEQTDCEKLGYKVGDKFVMLSDSHMEVSQGMVVTLDKDDRTDYPFFKDANNERQCIFLHRLKPYIEPSVSEDCDEPFDEDPRHDIDATLAERDGNYGSFDGHAAIAQALKAVMQTSENWSDMTDDKKEALEMIQHKIGRILNGNAEYKDSWHDIVGYAKLVDDSLED